MRTSVTAVALIALIVLAATPGQAQIGYSDFRNPGELSLVGTARIIRDTLRLTPSRANCVGAAWYGVRQHIDEGFITRFKFRISEPGGESDGVANGGDGIAFVIHHSDSGDTAIGFDGGQMGYGGIARSMAVEFDMWQNDFRTNADPSHNHISVHTNGFGRNNSDHRYSLGMTSNIQELGDGAVHDVVIQYLEKKLSIFIDDCTAPMLEVDVDIAEKLGLDEGIAWIGFTSGTASAWENHDIISWNFSSIGMIPSGSAALCEGDSLVLSVPTAGGDCVWSTGSHDRSITVREAGEYSVRVTETIGCWQSTYTRSVSVVVVPAPAPVITANRPLKICPGDTVVLDAGPGYASYKWSTGAKTQRISVGIDGSYAVVVTNELGCSRSSPPVKVEMRIPPSPSITASRGLVICPGDSVMLDAGEGYSGYLWSPGGERTRRITVRSGGSFAVEVTDKHGCTGRSQPVQVTVGTTLHPVIAVNGPTVFCEGEGVRLDAGPGYAKYEWSNGDTTQTILADQAGSYSVKVTSKGGCKGTSEPVIVTVHPRPLPSITPDRPPVICDGQNIVLDAGSGYTGYEWSNGDTTSRITVNRPGRYVVTVTNAAGCTGSATMDVAEGSIPPPTVTPGGDVAICGQDSITLDAGEGYARYEWSNGATGREIRVGDAGTFTVTVWNAAGCTAVSAPVRVTMQEAPQPVIQPDGPLSFCTGGSVRLHAPDGFSTYRWSTNEPGPSIVVSTSGAYTVTVTNEAGCSGTSPAVDVVVGVSITPEVKVLGPLLICAGESAILEAPLGYASYLWSNGEHTARIVVTTAGSYSVTVDAGGGCMGTSMPVTIQVRPGPPVPVIVENAGGLVTDPAAAYQWYLDGAPVNSANGRTHVPAAFGRYSVVVTDENGCSARSLPYPYLDARSLVSLPSIAGEPGTLVTIPLQLESSHGLDGQGADRFRAAVRFDGTLLIPVSITSCCGSVQWGPPPYARSGNDVILEFEASRSSGLTQGMLAQMIFRVAVGRSNATSMQIESFRWLDMNGQEANVGVVTTNGMFYLNNVCPVGGERLVNAEGEMMLKSVRPNPVSGIAEVEFEIVEDGVTDLYLVDIFGSRVLSIGEGEMQAGRYRLPFNVAALPAGLYFCVLRTPTERLTRAVQVER